MNATTYGTHSATKYGTDYDTLLRIIIKEAIMQITKHPRMLIGSFHPPLSARLVSYARKFTCMGRGGGGFGRPCKEI